MCNANMNCIILLQRLKQDMEGKLRVGKGQSGSDQVSLYSLSKLSSLVIVSPIFQFREEGERLEGYAFCRFRDVYHSSRLYLPGPIKTKLKKTNPSSIA